MFLILLSLDVDLLLIFSVDDERELLHEAFDLFLLCLTGAGVTNKWLSFALLTLICLSSVVADGFAF